MKVWQITDVSGRIGYHIYNDNSPAEQAMRRFYEKRSNSAYQLIDMTEDEWTVIEVMYHQVPREPARNSAHLEYESWWPP